MFDYLCVAALENRIINSIDDLHEHFVSPVRMNHGALRPAPATRLQHSNEARMTPQGSIPERACMAINIIVRTETFLKGSLMRFVPCAALAATLFLPSASFMAQGQTEGSRAVEGGGISVPGWTGAVDPSEQGQSLKDAKLSQDGAALHVTTGPAIAYWNPANKVSGNYTIKATFTEPKFMNLNTHPHPYGLFIAGNDMGTPQQSYLYCAAYGSGNFIVRGFGPEAFQMNGRHGEANPAVHKAPGQGQPVTQEIALSVKGNQVQCAINGTVVATYDKSALVTAGKLKSTDGIYGIRSAHNTDVLVTGLGKSE